MEKSSPVPEGAGMDPRLVLTHKGGRIGSQRRVVGFAGQDEEGDHWWRWW